MIQIAVGFTGSERMLDGRQVTARGLHGLLYNVLKSADPASANWLHEHPPPKPYTMLPYYDERNVLLGIRMSALSEHSAELLLYSWQEAQHRTWHLGRQQLQVRDVETVPRIGFNELAEGHPATRIGLNFLSPTAFKQGPGRLPLPLPRNVFRTPLKLWQTYAPRNLLFNDTWLDWCADNVFVTEHNINTASVTISHRQPPYLGFVGSVWFEVHHKAQRNKRNCVIFDALAQLAELSGVGMKTTMGMGAVEIVK